MTYGLPWSKEFVANLSDKEFRDEFVADQVRTRIAQLVRVLREQPDRKWTQSELGTRAGKKQNLISRLEDPDSAQPNVQTLLDICNAFDLPLWIDFPQWDDWLTQIKHFPSSKDTRHSFDANRLIDQQWATGESFAHTLIQKLQNAAILIETSTGEINDNFAPNIPRFAVASS